MECGSTLIRVSLYFVLWTLFWDGSLLFANFSSLRRSNMISNLSFISRSNRFVGYCVSTPFCCGLIWLNFIVISKHRWYLNVSIFQEEVTLLSLWNGKTIIIVISPRSSLWIVLPKMAINDDTCYDKNSNYHTNWNNGSRIPETNHTQPAATRTMKTGNRTVQNSRLLYSKNLLSKILVKNKRTPKTKARRSDDHGTWGLGVQTYHYKQATITLK